MCKSKVSYDSNNNIKEIVSPDIILQILNDYDPLKDKDKNMVVILIDPQENWNIQGYLGFKNLSIIK
jgi:hypothetical protein